MKPGEVHTLGRAARPHDAVLGAGAGLDGWIDLNDERATPLPGLLVYRFDAPLFFANGEYFRRRVIAALETNPGEETSIVLDMEGIGSIDTTAIEQFAGLVEQLQASGMTVSLARSNHRVTSALRLAGVIEVLGVEHIYPTINAAVIAHQHRTEN
jgi:MFS superfamily sulfate permease-like transporter